MSKKSDYDSKLLSDENREIDPDEVKKKIGNSEIDAAELAAFFSKYSRTNVALTERTMRQKIIAICEKSKGLLKESDFQKTVNGRLKYVFKPEYHGFIIPLIDSSYLLEKPNKRQLKVRNALMEDILVNIETYMRKEDLEIMKTNPAYYNAKLERLFSGAINKQMVELVREVYHVDEVVRFQEMKDVLDTLVSLNQNLARKNAHLESSKLVYGHVHDEDPDGEYRKALMQADTIGDFLVNLLALKMKGEKYEFLNEEEELSYKALWTSTKVYETEIDPSSEMGKKITETDAVVGNEKRIQEIAEKAKEVFNLDDPYEVIMYNSIMKQAMAWYAAPYVTEEDYAQTVKFIESAMASTKWDILAKFCSDEDWDSPFLQELRRINSLRGLSIKPDISEK